MRGHGRAQGPSGLGWGWSPSRPRSRPHRAWAGKLSSALQREEGRGELSKSGCPRMTEKWEDILPFWHLDWAQGLVMSCSCLCGEPQGS